VAPSAIVSSHRRPVLRLSRFCTVFLLDFPRAARVSSRIAIIATFGRRGAGVDADVDLGQRILDELA
jgi:hypothetical protein